MGRHPNANVIAIAMSLGPGQTPLSNDSNVKKHDGSCDGNVSFAASVFAFHKKRWCYWTTSLLSVTFFKVDLQMTSSIPALDGLWAWNRQGIHVHHAHSTKAFFTCCQLISLQVLSILRTAGFFASHAQLHRTSCSHDAHMMQTLRSAWWSCSTSFPCRHLQSIHIYPSFFTCGYSQWRNCVKNQEWNDWLHQFQSSHVDPTTRVQKMAGWIMNWWDVKCNRSGAHTALQSGFPIKQNKRNNHNKAGIPTVATSHFKVQIVNQSTKLLGTFSVWGGQCLLEKQCNTINTQTNPTALLRRCAVLKLNWDNWDLALTTWDETKASNTGWLFRWAEM